MVERKRFVWKLRTRSLQLGDRPLVMAILNVTPDSFSDGGQYSEPERALARALELEELGADLIDIGAESTRPGSARVSEGEELRRLVPVLKKLQGRLKVPISVDTYKSAVALKAAEYGAEIINDPSGFTWDTNLAKTVASLRTGFILNHMRGTPETWAKLGSIKDLIPTVRQDLEAAISRSCRNEVDKQRIVIDPGIGFGKRRDQNLELIAQLGALVPLNAPILVGPSRKQFLKQATDQETEFATAAAVTASILNGAHIVRVHDLASMRAAIQVAGDIYEAGRAAILHAATAAENEKQQQQAGGGRKADGRKPARTPEPGVNRVHATAAKPHESLSAKLVKPQGRYGRSDDDAPRPPRPRRPNY